MPLSPLGATLGPLGRSAGAAGPPLSALRVWYAAGAQSYTNGDLVSAVLDGSGNGFTATATGAGRPTFATGQVNGQPAFVFDATGAHILTLPDCLTGLTAGEIFYVVKAAAYPPDSSLHTGLSLFGNSGDNTHYSWVDGTIYDTFGTNARATVGAPPVTLAAWRLYNVSSGPGVWTARLNTTQLFTRASNTVGWATAPTVGASRDSASYWFTGALAELLIYSAVLDSTTRAAVAAYLNAKYALY